MPFAVELVNAPYETQRQILFYLLLGLHRFTAAAFDATGNGGYLAEAARLRWGASMIECVMLNDPWYREWMPKLKAEFEDGNLMIPRHADVQDDLGKSRSSTGCPRSTRARTPARAASSATATLRWPWPWPCGPAGWGRHRVHPYLVNTGATATTTITHPSGRGI